MILNQSLDLDGFYFFRGDTLLGETLAHFVQLETALVEVLGLGDPDLGTGEVSRLGTANEHIGHFQRQGGLARAEFEGALEEN